jgi:hypothetical protein
VTPEQRQEAASLLESGYPLGMDLGRALLAATTEAEALAAAIDRLMAGLPDDYRVTFAWNPRQQRWGAQARAGKGRVRTGAGAPTLMEAVNGLAAALAATGGEG